MTAQAQDHTVHTEDFDVLPIATLLVDETYQRELRERIIKDILAKGYDLNAAGIIIVSERPPLPGMRDPRYYIVDGMHRVKAAERSGETEVLAKIVRFKGSEAKLRMQEADLRGKFGVRKADTPQERFKHQLAAGSDESLAIANLVDGYGGSITLTQSKKGIGAISTLEKLYRRKVTDTATGRQHPLLDDVLRIIRTGWDTFDDRAGEASTLEAIGWMIVKHGSRLDERRLTRIMKSMPPEAVHARAVALQAIAGASLWKNYYRALLEAYNHRQTDAKKLSVVEF